MVVEDDGGEHVQLQETTAWEWEWEWEEGEKKPCIHELVGRVNRGIIGSAENFVKPFLAK